MTSYRVECYIFLEVYEYYWKLSTIYPPPLILNLKEYPEYSRDLLYCLGSSKIHPIYTLTGQQYLYTFAIVLEIARNSLAYDSVNSITLLATSSNTSLNSCSSID